MNKGRQPELAPQQETTGLRAEVLRFLGKTAAVYRVLFKQEIEQPLQAGTTHSGSEILVAAPEPVADRRPADVATSEPIPQEPPITLFSDAIRLINDAQGVKPRCE